MSRFLSGGLDALRAYVPGEQPRDKSYIKLNTNESPYPPAPQVLEAIGKNAIADLRLYSDPECTELRQALAARYGVSARNVTVGNGSDELLSFCFAAFCERGTGVSYPDISYGFYQVFAELYGLVKAPVPLAEDLSIRPGDYCGRVGAVFIANPNAPTGLCLSIEDIEYVVKSNPDKLVVIDEAYIDFGGVSCVPLTARYDNLLAVQTFSKSRSLAGARLGFAIGNEALIADLDKLRYSTNPYNVNRLTLLAGVAALGGQDYYDNNNQRIIRLREHTSAQLRKSGFYLTGSKANFIFARTPKLDGKALYLGLKARGILVRHFEKERIRDFVRITVGTQEQMRTLIDALKEMLD
ncbi:MAG: histidinol-phosphate transaminase [Oscillospiraceae bacterium]|jgi:histidinol-phosphate aminotransferase|nr:histidinol-phosphate transaminase [Oscillospiraceae bacterium]